MSRVGAAGSGPRWLHAQAWVCGVQSSWRAVLCIEIKKLSQPSTTRQASRQPPDALDAKGRDD